MGETKTCGEYVLWGGVSSSAIRNKDIERRNWFQGNRLDHGDGSSYT